MMKKKRPTTKQRDHCKPRIYSLEELSRKVDTIMATLAEVQNDLTQIQATVDALPARMGGVISQAELDGIKTRTAKILTDVQSLVSSGGNPPVPGTVG